jgi:mitochondrial fission protein ELM1
MPPDLKAQFQAPAPGSVSLCGGGSGLKIYYVLGDDEPTRGDSHGYAGLGRVMAQKLGGQFFQIDDEMLAGQYPDEEIWNRPDCFLRDHGPADIVLCRSPRTTGRFTDANTIFIEGRNENFSDLRHNDMLVAHHLTAEIFAQEGNRFASLYNDLAGDLIAVLLVDNCASAKLLGQSLVRNALKAEQSTLFITTCWRTPAHDYKDVMQSCRDAITEQGAQERVRLIGYNLDQEAGCNNPYIGLLDRADHIVLWGRSHSMFSEAAATGKTVHMSLHGLQNEAYLPLAARGIVRGYDFEETAGLVTSRHAPLNKTEEIADELISNIAYQLRKRGFLPPLSPGQYGPQP